MHHVSSSSRFPRANIILYYVINMRDLATSIGNSLSGLIDYGIRGIRVVKVDDGGLFLVDSDGAGKNGKEGGKLRENLHGRGVRCISNMNQYRVSSDKVMERCIKSQFVVVGAMLEAVLSFVLY